MSEAFVIDNERKALWAVRKIKETKQEMTDLVSYHNEQIQKAKESCEQDVSYYEGLLERYYHSLPDAVLRKTGKGNSSFSLPGVKMSFKPTVYKYSVDKDGLLAFVKSDPTLKDFIKVEETANWAEIKKISEDMEIKKEDPVTKEPITEYCRVLKDTGEVIPVSVTVQSEFKVSIDEKENVEE